MVSPVFMGNQPTPSVVLLRSLIAVDAGINASIIGEAAAT